MNNWTISITAKVDLSAADNKEILDRLCRGDVWAWAHVTVSCTCNECGAVGRDRLGACSYADEHEFRRGAYYIDMRDAAIDDMPCTCMPSSHSPTHASAMAACLWFCDNATATGRHVEAREWLERYHAIGSAE